MTLSYREQYEADYKAMMDRDQKAKDKGELKGRYIQETVADGYAYYVVKSVRGQTVTLEHVNISDGYSIRMIESMGLKIPLKYVKENLGYRDGIAELFAKR